MFLNDNILSEICCLFFYSETCEHLILIKITLLHQKILATLKSTPPLRNPVNLFEYGVQPIYSHFPSLGLIEHKRQHLLLGGDGSKSYR